MLGEYKVSRCSRRCFTLDRPLKEGEVYYSVVIEVDEDFERRDISAEAWEGPPAEALGWWKNRMPTADRKKLVLAPPEVLLDMLRRLGERPDKAKSRYLLALMLLRRRLLREESTRDEAIRNETPSSAMGESEPLTKCIRVTVLADGSQIDIPLAAISRSEIETLTTELNSLLYCDADIASDDDEHDDDSDNKPTAN